LAEPEQAAGFASRNQDTRVGDVADAKADDAGAGARAQIGKARG
jgi:hypothetical protein